MTGRMTGSMVGGMTGAPTRRKGGGAPSLFAQILAANPSVLFSAAEPGGLFQERTGASATTPTAVDGVIGSLKNWGALGGWATAATDAGRPRLREVSGKRRVATDGFDDFLRILFTQAQPFVRVSAIANISIPNSFQLFGGGSANVGALYSNAGNLALFSGAILTGAALPSGIFVVEERHNGVNSRIRIGTGSYTTGNAGTTVSGGITIGASNSGTAFTAIGMYASVAWSGAEPSADELTLARAYCADAAGVTL